MTMPKNVQYLVMYAVLVNLTVALSDTDSPEVGQTSNNSSQTFGKSVFAIGLRVTEVDLTQPILRFRLNATGSDSVRYESEYGSRECHNWFYLDEMTGDLFIISFNVHDLVICGFVAMTLPGLQTVARATVVVHTNLDALFEIALLPNDRTQVPENEPAGVRVSQVVIVPASGVDVQNIRCLLADASDNFRLDVVEEGVYELLTTRSLDRETVDHYVAFIVCSNNDDPPVRAVKTVEVFVEDVNDNAPVFAQESYHLTVRENNPSPGSLLSVKATDIDSGQNGEIVYAIDDDDIGFVKVLYGVVYTDFSFDYEKMVNYSFNVIAKDRGTPSLSSTATVTVTILDQNDNVPVFSADPYFFTIDKNHDQGTQVGMVSAFDADAPPYNQFTYELSSESDIFDVDQETGGISLKAVLGEDPKPLYHLTVAACDPDLGISKVDIFVFIE